MVTIAGRLEDGLGNPIADCQIELKAQKNSSAVLVRTSASRNPNDTGYYTMNVKPGSYAVRLLIDGCPPNYIGDIKVYSDSKPGTLNDFLLNLEESEITPELLAQVTDERKQAQDASLSAQNSATQASTTLVNTVKKTGESSQTVSGILSVETLQESGKRVYSPNNKPTASDISALSISGGTLTGELTSTKDSALRFKNLINRISSIIRFDGARLWVLFTNRDDPDGNFNELRPIGIHSETGNIDIGHSLTIKSIPVLKQGDGGISSSAITSIDTNSLKEKTGIYKYTPNTANIDIIKNVLGWSYGTFIKSCWSSGGGVDDNEANLIVQRVTSTRTAVGYIKKTTGELIIAEVITTANSTIDSNGFYKKASPICRLFGDDNITEVEGFKLAGCGLVNSEADGVVAKRVAVGHYEIHGSLGFAKEGWYITLPEDANGNKKIFAEYSTDDNNIITVKTFTRKFDIELCEVVSGEPIDITAERWIDLRLDMPVNEVIDETDL